MVNAIVMNSKDTVAVVTKEVTVGDDVTYVLDGKTFTIKAKEDIKVNHKVAIKPVKKGNVVIKYGEKIGYATMDIDVGDHVHTHNLSSKFNS